MNATQATVSSLMSCPVVCIDPETSAAAALVLAEQRGVHHFPIVSSAGLAGLVCTCDLEDASPSTRVLELSRRRVVTVSREATATEAAWLMANEAVGSLVVIGRETVCGILTREDLRREHPDLAQLLEEERCSACGIQKHLHPGPNGLYLCRSCRTRSQEADWLDVGEGD